MKTDVFRLALCACLCGVVLFLSAFMQDDPVSLFNKAAVASHDSNRTARRDAIRTAGAAFAKSGADTTAEKLMYGALCLELNNIAKAEELLSECLEEGGESAPLAAALLVRLRWARLREGLDDVGDVRAAYMRFIETPGAESATIPLLRDIPASIEARYNYYIALRRFGDEGEKSESIRYIKEIIDIAGDNSRGWIAPAALHNYHSWWASHLEETREPEAAISFLQDVTYGIFAASPLYEARTRDRILFIRLRQYVETENYAAGLKELQETVESFKPDESAYVRVSSALTRFSLFNQPAPEIDADTIIGSGFTSLAESRGKVVLLDFFTSGCGPCRASFPLMKELVKHYEGKPFQVVGMTLVMNYVTPSEGPTVKVKDRAEYLALMEKYRDDFQLPWPFVICDDKTNNIAYGEKGVPMTVIIDKKGVVRRFTIGFDSSLESEYKIIDQLLAEK